MKSGVDRAHMSQEELELVKNVVFKAETVERAEQIRIRLAVPHDAFPRPMLFIC